MPKPKPQYLSKVYTIDLNNVTNDSAANLPVSDATQTALNAKQNTLISGTNIKTINSTSLLGSGNIAIASSGTVTNVSSVDANATVANPTTTPAITIVSAPKLQNARTIGGVSFDGTANIVPQTIESANEATDTTCFPLFVTASGTVQLQPKNNTGLTYNSNTNNLSCTTFTGGLVGNVSGNVLGSLTGDVTGNCSGSSGSTTGNAGTATALQTARAINGTSFNGTADISLGASLMNLTTAANFTIPAGYGAIYARQLTINGGVTYTIGSGSILQIT